MLKSEVLRAKITKLEAEYANAVIREANTITPSKLVAGAKVTFKFGKGEAAAVIPGSVLGVVVPAEGQKGGTLVRILTGEGVNTRVVSVFVSAIVTVELEDEPAAE